MNKNELIDYISQEADTDLTKTAITEVVDLVFKGIKKGLKDDSETRLVGFGTFKVGHRKATTGRNPRTGESIQIPAKNVVKFTVGKELKEEVNK